MSDQKDTLAGSEDELAQKLVEDCCVVGGLRIWWIVVVMRVGNVADIYSAEVGRGQRWAVGFDVLRFWSGEEGLVGFRGAVGVMADDHDEWGLRRRHLRMMAVCTGYWADQRRWSINVDLL